MSKILVIEDEVSIQKLLTYDLKQAGYDVDVACDGNEGYKKAKDGQYDLIILDLMLPKMNGIELCQKLRNDQNDVYIIMLTARDDEMDKVTGLDAGADDYMTKPFSPREVIARIKAGLRRKTSIEINNDLITVGNVKVDLKRHEVFVGNDLVTLTFKEYELLLFLIKNKEIALSRDVLLEKLWGFEYDGDTRIVDVHIFKLREKMTQGTIKIVTIRGIGYRLEEELNEN
jgi:two-component system, OmpR family, alkaline phosphatase synthesis response regulator PhoP